MRRPLTAHLFLVAVALLGASRVVAAPSSPGAVAGPCPAAGCGKTTAPWISLTFSGDGWSARTVQTVLADLRADLAQRQIELDLPANRKPGSSEPIASIDIAKEGINAVAIQVDIPEGGATRRLSRVTALDAVTNDGRPLAIALTAGELLRVSWVRIALRRAAERAAAANAGRPDTPTPPTAPDPSANKAQATPPATEAKDARQSASGPAPTDAVAPGVAGDIVVSDSPTPPQGPAPWNVGMALAGTWLLAPPLSTRNVPTSMGIGLRGAVTGHRYGVSAGVLFPTQASLDLGDATARERRFVGDVGGRAVWRGRYVNLGVDLGLLLAYRRIDGMDLARNAGSGGVDAGLRGGLVVAFGQSRVVPWVGAAAEILPFSPAIKLAPAGTVGHSPAVWVGASAGFTARLVGPWWP